MSAYYLLAIAICAEVIGTVSMKAVKGLSTPVPLLLVIVGYAVAFWMLTLVVRSIPVGVAYAVWAGDGHRHGQHRGADHLRPETRSAGHCRHGDDRRGGRGDPAVLETAGH